MRGSVIATSVALALALGGATAAAQPRGDDDSAELVDAGRRALTRGDLRGAARALDQAIGLNPRRVEAYLLRAAVWAAAGDPARGVALVRKARELAPSSDDVAAALGTQLMLAGQPDEAVPLLEQVLARAPDRYEAHALLGHYYAGRERWREAVIELEAYRRTRPSNLAAGDDRHALDLAQGYLRTGRASDARAAYDGLATRHPDWMAARLGQAWATAAIDCRQARPLLAAIAKAPEVPASVVLVDGQCALAMGQYAEAQRAARRYLDEEPDAAPGFALLGEATAGRGDLPSARVALSRARALEPDRVRYAVRLARVLRAAGDRAAALAELEPLTVAPGSPDFRDYWVELGEAAIAKPPTAPYLDRLRAALAVLPDDPELLTTVGGAELMDGQLDAAVVTLEHAMTSGATGPRVRDRLVATLLGLGDLALGTADLVAAERIFTRVDQLAPQPVAWRGLGLVRLARGDVAGAREVLDRNKLGDADAMTLILWARAQAASGDLAAARASLTQANVMDRGSAEIAIERASLELIAGAPDAAVDALVAVAPAQREAHRDRVVAALVTARHAAGLAALRDGKPARALELLDAAVKDATGDASIAIRCDGALAAVATGDRDRAAPRLKAIARVRCPFPTPADSQAVPILTAFVDGLEPRRAGKAADKLAALARSATGVSKTVASSALRVIAMTAAEKAYRDGKLAAARKLLATARAGDGRAGADELAYDLAALDLADGDVAAARAGFARVGNRVPEALIGAGIVADRAGDGAAALELWRQAKRAGARLSTLDEWIAAKERIYGTGGR